MLYAYQLGPRQVAEALRKLFGPPGVTVEAPSVVAEALTWHLEGLDFADALHLASSRKADRFAALARDLARRAKKIAVGEVIPP